jgi:hypothetical protein
MSRIVLDIVLARLVRRQWPPETLPLDVTPGWIVRGRWPPNAMPLGPHGIAQTFADGESTRRSPSRRDTREVCAPHGEIHAAALDAGVTLCGIDVLEATDAIHKDQRPR